MSILRQLLPALCLLAGACSPQDSTSAPAQSIPKGSGYDFFVLSLSWSPTYCEVEGADANRQQCGAEASHGFVVHGLWPQNESGWPEFCDSSEPSRVSDATVRTMLDIMPSAGLIGHQWRKHGTCAGMNHEDYFAVTRAAFDAVSIPNELQSGDARRTVSPDAVVDAFISANPGMEAGGLAVTCDGRLLSEVRICMSHDLTFRTCDDVAARSCRIGQATMPPRD